MTDAINYIKNSGFEILSYSRPGMPSYWYTDQTGTTAVMSYPELGRDGVGKSIKIYYLAVESGKYAVWYQSKMPIDLSKTYTLMGSLKTENLTDGSVNIGVRWVDINGVKIYDENPITITDSRDWQEYSTGITPLIPPVGTVTANIRCSMVGAAGSVWFDDLFLEIYNLTPTTYMVRYGMGDIPVIILSGQNGTYGPARVYQRSCINQTCDCNLAGDSYCNEITENIIQKMGNLGKNPYFVIGDFHRSYIDTNRSPECAYEDPDAALYFDTYHDKIREYVDILRQHPEYKNVFLFDIHGTRGLAEDIWAVYIGTRNGNVDPTNSSIKQLLIADPNVLSILRQLFTYRNYAIQPSIPGETELYQGAYTLQTYGSNNDNGIESIQFELDNSVRFDPIKREQIAKDLADIIIDFISGGISVGWLIA